MALQDASAIHLCLFGSSLRGAGADAFKWELMRQYEGVRTGGRGQGVAVAVLWGPGGGRSAWSGYYVVMSAGLRRDYEAIAAASRCLPAHQLLLYYQLSEFTPRLQPCPCC